MGVVQELPARGGRGGRERGKGRAAGPDNRGALRTGGKYLRLYSRVSHCEIRKIEVHCIETAIKQKEKKRLFPLVSPS